MYDLCKPLDRRGTSCAKWDGLTGKFGSEGLLAMWVADMDFKEPACVTEALRNYVDSTAFGYYNVPDAYYNAFINWESSRHGYQVEREWIRFSPGVVPAINWLVNILTKPGDGIIVLTPVYYPFLNAVKDNGRTLVECDLINTDGVFTVDFAAFERMVEEQQVKLFIMSSPHNPVGRVWTRDELKELTAICARHGVRIISDEIHGDFSYGDPEHTPTALCAPDPKKIVTLTSASKTFNLAGLQNSFAVIPDPELRGRFDKFAKSINITNGNTFGYIAYTAAYTGGAPWLAELKGIIKGNYDWLRQSFADAGLGVVMSPLEGTYLSWIDFKNYLKPEEIADFMQEKCRIAVDLGGWFGGDRFNTFIRMNLATPRENVEAAFAAISRELRAL